MVNSVVMYVDMIIETLITISLTCLLIVDCWFTDERLGLTGHWLTCCLFVCLF